MRKWIFALLILGAMVMPVSASELLAPEVPEQGAQYMPEEDASFGDGLIQILRSVLPKLRPDLAEGCAISIKVCCAVLLLSILRTFSGSTKTVADIAGSAAISALLLSGTNSMIRLGSQTILEMGEYGKLLLPVMTAAMAAQGGITASAALYAGTAAFGAALSNMISRLLIPMVYFFLALSVSGSAIGEDLLKKTRDMVKGLISWCLKSLLTIFTTYMGITGVISGSTDAAALKATKVTISTFVPVVGGILSDASEAILVSAGLARSAAGLYGIFAILALFLEPFCRIGVHYLLLKATAALCCVFGTKQISELVGDFSAAMGLLLGMTGSACLLQLISTICFMKGVG